MVLSLIFKSEKLHLTLSGGFISLGDNIQTTTMVTNEVHLNLTSSQGESIEIQIKAKSENDGETDRLCWSVWRRYHAILAGF